MMQRRTLVVLFSLFLFSCTTTPTGRQQLALLSDQEVSRMGVRSYEQIKKEQPLSRNQALSDYVVCVARHIIPHVSQAPRVEMWEVHLFANRQANAFALPGYKIGVYEGLLDYAENEDQLAAVIGHEIGHVIAHHARERLSTQMATELGIKAGSALFGVKDPQNSLGVKIAALGAQYGVILPFSREHETEADMIGLQLMAKSGFDPRQSIRLWQNMSKDSNSVPEILSTHPSNQNRIKHLQSAMRKAMVYYQKSTGAGKTKCKKPI